MKTSSENQGKIAGVLLWDVIFRDSKFPKKRPVAEKNIHKNKNFPRDF